MSKKYLLIGGVSSDDPQSYGGTTVLMQQMVDYFKENNKDYILIKTNIYTGKLSVFLNFSYVIFNIFRYIFQVDIIMVNVARNGAFILSPIVYLIVKMFRKEFVFRMFGGNFVTLYQQSKMKQKIANWTFLKADVIFVETKEILNFVKNINQNTFWFPNTRKQLNIKKENDTYTKKFVFISSVKATKGIDEIVYASQKLDDSYTIDIYGPIQDKKYSIEYFQERGVNYKGSLTPKNVIRTLSIYDVLLLPSFHPGEGYPGIIIEAYSLGIPCISTQWQAIPEIVDDKETGLLVEPKSSTELINAMLSLDNEFYEYLSNNALEKFEIFRYENVYRHVISICEKEY